MGVFIAVIGGIVTLVCFVNGVSIFPESAPQQTVQELRFIEAALGAILFASGIEIYELHLLRRTGAEKKGSTAPEPAKEKLEEVGSTFIVGSRVMHKDRGAGKVTKIDGDLVKVQFGSRSSYHLYRDLKPLSEQSS
ncbi:MAG: hypothetical protein WB611_10480 [Stellaceae bacterium]